MSVLGGGLGAAGPGTCSAMVGALRYPGPTGPSLALHHLLLHTSLPQGRFTLDEEPDLPLVVLHVVQAKSRGLKKVLMSFNF